MGLIRSQFLPDERRARKPKRRTRWNGRTVIAAALCLFIGTLAARITAELWRLASSGEWDWDWVKSTAVVPLLMFAYIPLVWFLAADVIEVYAPPAGAGRA